MVQTRSFSTLYCSDRLGSPMEEFKAQVGTAQAREMNCECAFARHYLGEGLTKPTCEENGNFRAFQCQGGKCYCVDSYGRQTKKEVDQLDIQSLDCSSTSV